MVNPDAPLFLISCRTGDGIGGWASWLVSRCRV